MNLIALKDFMIKRNIEEYLGHVSDLQRKGLLSDDRSLTQQGEQYLVDLFGESALEQRCCEPLQSFHASRGVSYTEAYEVDALVVDLAANYVRPSFRASEFYYLMLTAFYSISKGLEQGLSDTEGEKRPMLERLPEPHNGYVRFVEPPNQ